VQSFAPRLASILLARARMFASRLVTWSFALGLGIVAAAGCATDDGYVDDPSDGTWTDGKADGATPVDIAATHLNVHLGSLTAVATIELEQPGNVELEVEGLSITKVSDHRGKRHYTTTDGKLRVTNVEGSLVVEYGFTVEDMANGLLANGSTLIWPYFCGNLFPCHSLPADGETFTLALDGVPSGSTAVYPKAIANQAPPYQIAWAVGDYTRLDLGTTSAGTQVGASYLPGGKTDAIAGTKHLEGVFDWYEQTIGPYQFGGDVGSVSVAWGGGAFGGMEHHPYWHVSADAMSDEVTHAHEAAHGWFGDGVRLRCWEDFVLSEGTVCYLAAHSLGKIAGAAEEAKVWQSYAGELGAAVQAGGSPAWPEGCNQIDILKDGLWTNLPYMECAFFYKDVAAQVGADVLDGVLHDFYLAHRGQPAGMQDMVDLIQSETGFDPSALVASRLRKKF
jgi:hypothetical protein